MADAFVACAFFYARGAGPAAGSGTLPEAGAGPFVRDGVRHFARGGVRHFARDGVRHLCQRRGQAPLSEMGSGTSACGGVRHSCQRWGQVPLPAVGSDPRGDCDISALALYSALFYNSWCWWQHKYSIRW